MADIPDIRNTPQLPQDGDGPVFKAPWEAKAFAMAVSLHKQGVFQWAEWVETIAAEIKSAQQAGDPDLGDTYYEHWLKALEKLVTAKKVATTDELTASKEDWRAADHHRSFGEAPILVKGAGGHNHA